MKKAKSLASLFLWIQRFKDKGKRKEHRAKRRGGQRTPVKSASLGFWEAFNGVNRVRESMKAKRLRSESKEHRAKRVEE